MSIVAAAKEHLNEQLRWAREALVWKLDGLSEYDVLPAAADLDWHEPPRSGEALRHLGVALPR